MISPSLRIDPSNARVHFAARMIAHYVSSARSNAWYVSPDATIPDAKVLIQECASRWPEEKIQLFSAYAICRLFARHNSIERIYILAILEEVYGYDFKFPIA
jgi:hypothetical protein